MGNIIISKATFERHCPVGVDAESEIFNALLNFFDAAYEDLTFTLLGNELAAKLIEIFDDENAKGETLSMNGKCMPSTIDRIKHCVEAYVCNRALYNAIPSLDLVLTNNGFGVVNTRDIIPAIPERVNRLRLSCSIAADAAFDKLIVSLPGNSLTHGLTLDSKQWLQKTQHLIWTVSDYETYCTTDGTSSQGRNDLNKASAMLYKVEGEMAAMISWDQLNDFVDMQRGIIETDRVTLTAMALLMAWLSAAYRCGSADIEQGYRLIAYMDSHIDNFEKYATSDEYAARHKTTHSSSRTDGCFVFR